MTSLADQIISKLEPYGLKNERGGKYRCNNPFRAGSDGMSFTLLIEDENHGTYYDHRDGVGGKLSDLGQKLGCEMPKRTQVADSKIGYKDLAEYAKFKGVPVEAFTAAGWSNTVKTVTKRPALEFKTATGKRWRFIDGNKPPFMSEPGYKPCWYGLNSALAMPEVSELVLCNGEASTIVAQYFKVPAFCKTAGEGQRIPDELIQALQKSPIHTIYIALDCDAAGQKGAWVYYDQLTAVGFDCIPVDLMLLGKGDLADHCKLYQDTSLDTLWELPKLERAGGAVAPPDDLRELTSGIKAIEGLLKEGNQFASLTKELDKAQNVIDQIRLKHAGEIVINFAQVREDYITDMLAAKANPGLISGLKTGITKLDNMIGGLDYGTVTTILAEVGMGKTTLAASCASKMLEQERGIIIPTETRTKKWLGKLVAYMTQIPSNLVTKGMIDDNQVGQITAMLDMLEKSNVMLECQNPTPALIMAAVRQRLAKEPIRWVIIDSISFIKGDNARDGLYESASAAATLILELARLNLAVLVTSHVGRKMDGRASRIPQLSDGKGSGDIEQNSDVVIGLYNHGALVKKRLAAPSKDFPEDKLLLVNLKHRNDEEGHSCRPFFRPGIGVYG